jgi:hypothetical protein
MGWYTAVRNGLGAAYITPANTDFSAHLCPIYCRGYSHCVSRECHGFESLRSPSHTGFFRLAESPLSLSVATFRRHTASPRASTEWRTPASHATTVPISASTSAPAAENLTRRTWTLNVMGPGAECSSSRSPSFITSSTTFKPPPLRSVMAFRRPLLNDSSSRNLATCVPRSNACNGRASAARTPGAVCSTSPSPLGRRRDPTARDLTMT